MRSPRYAGSSRGTTRGPSRRELLGTALLGPAVASTCARAPRSDRPANVLVLVADDQSRVDVHGPGSLPGPLPAIRALREEGLALERFYTPIPLCQPARSALYTGLLPQRNGVFAFQELRPGTATWPALLQGRCFTGMIGKLNVAPAEALPFDHLERLDDDPVGRSPAAARTAFARFLERAGPRRFCAVVNLLDPHRPFGAGGGAEGVTDPGAVEVPPFLADLPEMRAELARYHDAMDRLDRCVAAVLEELGGRSDDTLVVYTSDNGMPFPFAKSTLYEPGVNLPFLARWPGAIRPGTRQLGPASLTDLLPTVLEAFGAESPERLDGRSLLDRLTGSDTAPKAPVVCRMTATRAGLFPARSLRLGDWKYVLNLEPEKEFHNSVLNGSRAWAAWRTGRGVTQAQRERAERLVHRPREELYDLATDPWELVDLARETRQAEALERLRGALAAELEAQGDKRHRDVPRG